MKKVHILLIYFLCFKQICTESCDHILSSRNEWFTKCQSEPCPCIGVKSWYCVLDKERKCDGCVGIENKSDCLCAGESCRCIPEERFCNNYCTSREEPCDGKCIEDDRVCKKRCITRKEVCDGKYCGELDWLCKGECIPQTASCNGKFYSQLTGCAEDHWKCGKEGMCIPHYQNCNGECNTALDYWKCGDDCKKGDRDLWETHGSACRRKPKNNNSKNTKSRPCDYFTWECNGSCILREKPCDGKCNTAKGDWKCGAKCENKSAKKYKKGSCKPNITDVSNIDTTFTDGENHFPIATIVGICSAGFVGVLAIIVGIVIYCKAKDKKEKNEIKYIDDNPEYNYGEADDDIEVVDYNDYYGDSDEETHV